MKRNREIDCTRGIAILLVVLGHSIGNSEVLANRMILSFHMPLFFFLSGYLAKNKKSDFLKEIGKKSYALLIPQMSLAILRFLYLYFISYHVLHNISLDECNLIKCFFEMWFLLVLWQVYLLWELWCTIINYARSARSIKIIMCIIVAAVCLIIPRNVEQPMFWNVIPYAFVFFVFGNASKKMNLIPRIQSRGKNTILIGTAIAIATVSVCVISYINIPVLMYKNQYGNIFLFCFGAITGICLVLILGCIMHNVKILNYFGKNSIAVYVLHFNLVQGFRGVIVRLFPQLNDVSMDIMVFACSLCAIMLLMYLTLRYCPWIYGKKVKTAKKCQTPGTKL